MKIVNIFKAVASRTSHEVRGLKWKFPLYACYMFGRTSHEVRGLKYIDKEQETMTVGRTSHEVRGLKYR